MSELSLSGAEALELVNESKIYNLLAGSSEDDTIDAGGAWVMKDNFCIFRFPGG